jgi:hypothetical protein
MLDRPMETFILAVLRWRVAVLIAIAGLCGLSAWSLSHAQIGSSIAQMILGESPEYARYLHRMEDYGTDEVLALGLDVDDALAPEMLDRIDRITKKLEAHKEVRRVSSLLDAFRLKSSDDRFQIETYADLLRAHPEQRDSLLQEMLADPLLGGRLVSTDGKRIPLLVELHPGAKTGRKEEEAAVFVEDFLSVVEAEGVPRESIHLSGTPAMIAEMFHQTMYSLKRVFPASALILLLTVFFTFRRFWPAALASVIALLGVLLLMGFAVAMDPHIDVMLSVTPVVILIVAFSDVIHLCSAYLMELDAGKTKDEAILSASTDVGRACLYTSLTTFTGFVGMALVPTPAFRRLGIVLGFGVGISLLLAVTLVPIAFHYMQKPHVWRTNVKSRWDQALDYVLDWLNRFSVRYARWVIIVFAASIIAALMGLNRLHIDTSLQDRLDSDNPLTIDSEWFEEHFGQAYFVDLYVDTSKTKTAEEARTLGQKEADPPTEEEDSLNLDWGNEATEEEAKTEIRGECGGLCDPALFARLGAFEDRIREHPEVNNVTSITTLMGTLHERWASDQDTSRFPSTASGLASHMLLFSSGADDTGRDSGLDRMMDSHRDIARITVQLKSDWMRAAHVVGSELQSTGAEILPADVTVESTGILYLLGDWVDEIIEGQKRGVGFTFLVITFMMIFAFRSLRDGVLTMIPNIYPVLILGGTLSFLYSPVDSDVLVLAMLAIGIGVDDTIHFVMRYRLEASRCASATEAIRNTFEYAGRAIVITTVTLALGFFPFASSDYTIIAMFGTLLPLTLFMALIADLLLVPAMIEVGLLSFPGPPNSD